MINYSFGDSTILSTVTFNLKSKEPGPYTRINKGDTSTELSDVSFTTGPDPIVCLLVGLSVDEGSSLTVVLIEGCQHLDSWNEEQPTVDLRQESRFSGGL